MKFPATQKYLKLFQAANGGASHYRVAQLLNVSRQAVYDWRDDRRGMSEEIGMIIADRLKLDVVEVVSELNKDRAQSRELRKYYDELIARIKTTAALALPAFASILLVTNHGNSLI